jgi:ribose/xylose/arabinose/galactoside ABC-type transport system permease subunit
MGLGGIIAAEVLNAGGNPYLAFTAAAIAGMIVGLINYLIIRRIFIPSFILTFLVGTVIVIALNLFYNVRTVFISDDAFGRLLDDACWLLGLTPENQMNMAAPMMTVRMLMVFCVWAGVLIIFLIGDMLTSDTPRPFARWWVRPAALITSGMLAGLAGAGWLIDHGETPVPMRPVDNLHIPAVVILAGTMLLQGRGRTLMVGICLPTAILVVALWEQISWPMWFYGYSLEILIFMVMVSFIQWTLVWAMDYPSGKTWIGWLVMSICTAGLIIIALTPKLDGIISPKNAMLLGLSVWMVGAVALAISIFTIIRIRRKTDYDD